MTKYMIIISVIIFCIWSAVHSEVLFEDSFDTDEEWGLISGNPEETLENGMYIIDSRLDSSLALALHSADFDFFSYTMKMKFIETEYAKSGIVFCWNGINGYAFFIVPQEDSGNLYYYYSIEKYFNGKTEVLKRDYCSYITESDNTIKVCKKGEKLRFFCNGVCITELTDSDYESGDIGFAVYPGDKVGFDNALVTDEWDDSEEINSFSDSFDDTELKGWVCRQGKEYVESKDGVLKISSADDQVLIITSGNFKNATCTTIVTYKGGEDDELYGLMYEAWSFDGIEDYNFLINAKQQFTVCGKNGVETGINGKNGKPDTLIVTKDYRFIINGKEVAQAEDKGFKINLVGFFVDEGVSVEFDNFIVGPGIVPIKYFPQITSPFGSKRQSYLLGGSGLIYDTRGRKVASFVGGYKEQLKSIAPGSYYLVIRKGKKNHFIRRTIINVK